VIVDIDGDTNVGYDKKQMCRESLPAIDTLEERDGRVTREVNVLTSC